MIIKLKLSYNINNLNLIVNLSFSHLNIVVNICHSSFFCFFNFMYKLEQNKADSHNILIFNYN